MDSHVESGKAPGPSEVRQVAYTNNLASNYLEPNEFSQLGAETLGLSVLRLSTATYSWRPLLPASEMSGPPRLYVDYHNVQPLYTPYDFLKSSTINSCPFIPRFQVPTNEGLCRRGPSWGELTCRCGNSPRPDSVPPRYALSKCFPSIIHDCNGYRSNQDQSSNRTLSVSPCDSIDSNSDENIQNDVSRSPPVDGTWAGHAKEIRLEDGATAYLCLWKLRGGLKGIVCNYMSKKQLVKRHIETTHLKMKPFVCVICYKAFPQKSALKVHVSGHTGEKPHECKYECGLWFKDPARRHRHHVDVHAYVPKKRFGRRYNA